LYIWENFKRKNQRNQVHGDRKQLQANCAVYTTSNHFCPLAQVFHFNVQALTLVHGLSTCTHYPRVFDAQVCTIPKNHLIFTIRYARNFSQANFYRQSSKILTQISFPLAFFNFSPYFYRQSSKK